MKRLRFVHAADLHLDSPFKGMSELPLSLREQVRESTFRSLASLIKLSIHEQADFVVISGDIYDLADRSLRAQIRFQKAMELLAAHDIQAFVIHGNHDPEDGRAAMLNWPAAVHFFASDRVQTVSVEKEGRGVIAQLHGISYRTAAVTDNLSLQYRAGDSSVYQIGLLHTNVEGDPGHGNYAPCTKQDLLAAGMHYWALGHVHTRKVLHAEPAIVYPGNLQGRSIRELGPRGCYIVDVNEEGKTELTFHALDSLRWFLEEITIQGIEAEQQLRDLLEEQMETIRAAGEGRDCIVRFELVGRGAVHSMLRKGRALQEILAELRDEESKRHSRQADVEMRSDTSSGLGFVWIESIVDLTGNELERDLLLQQKSFVGDLLRLSQTLQLDEAALRAFAGEALTALQALPPSAAGAATAESEQRQQWLRAAEELAADLLVGDGGWDG
jgi:exonuclease SbcD